jgi:bifunctional UDP-N-acetylglucosamine pyrophosphorylase/glucosamine-1-phosphate N-acetyltransferase
MKGSLSRAVSRLSQYAPQGFPAVVLAAGKGTRMKASRPKAAVHLNGKPMAARVVSAMRAAGASRVIAVVGHRAEDVRAAIGDTAEYVVQEEQRGTGHAVRCAAEALSGYVGPLVVGYADIPLLTPSDLAALVLHHFHTGADATLLTARFEEPGTLGRIVRSANGQVEAIVEARDASEEQLGIREINVGVYCFRAPLVFQMLALLTDDNAQGQYYLTDVIGLLVKGGGRVEAIPAATSDFCLGVDTAADLALAEQVLAATLRERGKKRSGTQNVLDWDLYVESGALMSESDPAPASDGH